MVTVGVILNGCGHRDGTELHEAVLTLLALEEAGAKVRCLGLAKPQAHVTDHVTGKASHETRSMLTESARIARGSIESLLTVRPNEFDAIVIPGGSGTAANLCDFATAGEKMQVDRDLEAFLKVVHAAKKPIGAICIAPIILAKLFGLKGARLTFGDGESEVALKAVAMGVTAVACKATECVVDSDHLFISTPAYMLPAKISEINQGIRKLAVETVRLAELAQNP